MKIAENKVIGLSYVLHNKEGELIDEASKEDPIELLVGHGSIIPSLEKELIDLKIGDKKTVSLDAKDAYGEDKPELRIVVKKSDFPEDVELEPGFEFVTELENGESQLFVVIELDGDEVKIDGNHPLAGESLVFQVEVMSVREPTEDEIAHGHVHSDGCDH